MSVLHEAVLFMLPSISPPLLPPHSPLFHEPSRLLMGHPWELAEKSLNLQKPWTLLFLECHSQIFYPRTSLLDYLCLLSNQYPPSGHPSSTRLSLVGPDAGSVLVGKPVTYQAPRPGNFSKLEDSCKVAHQTIVN